MQTVDKFFLPEELDIRFSLLRSRDGIYIKRERQWRLRSAVRCAATTLKTYTPPPMSATYPLVVLYVKSRPRRFRGLEVLGTVAISPSAQCSCWGKMARMYIVRFVDVQHFGIHYNKHVDSSKLLVTWLTFIHIRRFSISSDCGA